MVKALRAVLGRSILGLPPTADSPLLLTSRYWPGAGPSKKPAKVDDRESTALSCCAVIPMPSSSAVIAPADEPLIPAIWLVPGFFDVDRQDLHRFQRLDGA
ncbi:hypothetical protein [Nonomuraea glycinis]|uniref:hypothetical protein n=1 Tax=Nonomuraea glycinis TaxID=2047744 RepID=UPI002E127BD6|nr:hypothetical protein OHA68_35490 [Nonomuraea glycinis]